MRSKHEFSRTEATEIEQLLREKNAAGTEEQKKIRHRLRSIGLYLSDFTASVKAGA